MFGLLSRCNTAAKARARPARLNLEELECRAVPTTLTMNVAYGTGTNVTLSGQLSGMANNANQTISITGEASGATTTNANGNYTITLKASGLGKVSAMAPDLTMATQTLTDPGAVITGLTASEGPNDIWTFTGTVSYARPFSQMTMTIGGQPVVFNHQQTSPGNPNQFLCGANGTFSICEQMDGKSDDNGLVWVSITDAWGTPSQMAYTQVYQTGT